MATRKKGLGRGLDALLSPNMTQDMREEIPLHLIDPNPDQPRKDFDAQKLQELADSIREHGILQPLLVVPQGDRYLLVAGERRWRAARLAGLNQAPVLVRDYDARQIAEIALVENLQRDDLNALDEALGVRALIETFHITQEQVAQRLGISRPAVTNALRLLALPAPVQEGLRKGSLSAGHARALAGLDDAQLVLSLAKKAENGGMSVRQLEAAVRRHKQPQAEKLPAGRTDFGDLEENLMHALGTRVHVQGTAKKGKIIVEYFNRDDLERIYELAQRMARES